MIAVRFVKDRNSIIDARTTIITIMAAGSIAMMIRLSEGVQIF